MCKILAFTNMSKIKSGAEDKIGAILNEIERDGFGYAISGDNGVFGEKSVAKTFASRFDKQSASLSFLKVEGSTFGKKGKYSGPGIFHGRTSTNHFGLKNCHPMQRENWNLIHNGVVTDHGPKYTKTTTNDSEDLLQRLILGISDVEKELTGYYAFGAIDPFGRLHICRDGIANLYATWSQESETFIFGTSIDLIKQVTNKLKIKIGAIDSLEDNVYAIFKGNEVVHQQGIVSRGFERAEAMHAEASLGFSIEDATKPYGEAWRESQSKINEDEDAYYAWLHEIDRMDESYTIESAYGHALGVTEFKALDEYEKEACLVRRQDGTILSPWAVGA